MTSSDTVTIRNSVLSVEGSAGVYAKAMPGSGGGSGGSVQVITKSISGNGLVHLKGGDGSLNGGGGGSGGRLVTHFLKNFNTTAL